MVNIYPDDVLITFHFYILENNKNKMFFDRYFQSIEVNKKNVCVLLYYVECYLKYKQHLCFELNYNRLMEYIEMNWEEYGDMVCVNNFLAIIKELLLKISPRAGAGL